MKPLAQPAMDAVKSGKTKVVPERFNKIYFHWLENIKDWCISRQLWWGHQIPAFYCDACGEMVVTKEDHAVCPKCGKPMRQDPDTLDTWFSSALWPFSTLGWPDNTEELKYFYPTNTLVTGYDIIFFWVVRMMFSGLKNMGEVPFDTVLIHGLVRDEQGRKMSKSLGNGIMPEEIVKQYGADILRLWVASSDYHSDIRISKAILGQLSDAYKKIRNTARYILGNLGNGDGFHPDRDSVSDDQLMELDRWALMRLDNVIQKAHEGYEAFDFHIVFHAIHNYCTTDLSNFYLDIIKDRLYCEKEDSVERRAAQTTIYRILSALTRLIAPILSFTAEEIWSYLPHAASDDAKSVFLNEMPKASGLTEDADFMAKWDLIYQIRMDANKVLEEKRNEKLIGKSLEAKVTISVADDAQYAILSDAADVLAKVLIVSEVSVGKAESGDTTYTVERAAGEKCERCWMYLDSVGKNAAHPTLCARCASVVDQL